MFGTIRTPRDDPWRIKERIVSVAGAGKSSQSGGVMLWTVRVRSGDPLLLALLLSTETKLGSPERGDSSPVDGIGFVLNAVFEYASDGHYQSTEDG